MNERPLFRTDYRVPPPGTNMISPNEERAVAAAASREAVKEEMAFDRALGRRPRPAQPELPTVKAPTLPDDFRQKVSALDNRISRRGLGISRGRLVSLGRERFGFLLEADRKCRAGGICAGVDLTRFETVQSALHAFLCQIVPPRTTSEQASGRGRERGVARQISGWNDLWKATWERQETLDDLYGFHDRFESLMLGHSMLEQLSSDGRARSPLFRGGKGPKVGLFLGWLPAVEGGSAQVKLAGPVWSVVSWLTSEKALPPLPSVLAAEFFNVRAPTPAQERIAAATFDGFLLGLDGWPLWDAIGKAARTAVNETRLASWRGALAKSYPRITEFHALVAAAFYRDVGFGYETHREFDPAAARVFIQRTVARLLDCAGALLALGLDEVFPGAVLARFEPPRSLMANLKHSPKSGPQSSGS